jgi:hypothetical protein
VIIFGVADESVKAVGVASPDGSVRDLPLQADRSFLGVFAGQLPTEFPVTVTLEDGTSFTRDWKGSTPFPHRF